MAATASMNRQRLARQAAPYFALVAAAGLQLLFVEIFVAGWRIRAPTAPRQALARALIVPSPMQSRPPPPVMPSLTGAASMTPVPVTPPASGPALRWPLPSRADAPLDWVSAAQQAADQMVDAEALAQRHRQASGEAPWPAASDARRAHPSPPFPWSRQPITGWFDFDPTKLVTSIRLGKHCGLFFLVIIPAFGCVLGHIDPDPGRGDLFAAKFRPAPLKLPPAPLLFPSEPWSAPTPER